MADYVFTQNGDNNVQIGTDRLTGDFKGASMFATVEQARQYNRLRQYEDTGLTPDEIADLRDENDRLHAALKLAQARAGDYEAEADAWRRRAEAKRTCEGCIERGKWENEIEYGCSCPCLPCARRCQDNWRGPEEDKHE